jgi:hypothetical protein
MITSSIAIGSIVGIIAGFVIGWILRHECDRGIHSARERAAYLRGRRDLMSGDTAIVRPLANAFTNTKHN